MKWNNKQSVLWSIIYLGIFVAFQNVNCSQDSNREDLLRKRIAEYYQYFQDGEWENAWEFLSKRMKKHMASLPEAPSDELGLKEDYVDYMKHFFGGEEKRNQYYTFSTVKIEYKNNQAHVLMTGKYKDEDLEGENVWVYEDSNWFLDKY